MNKLLDRAISEMLRLPEDQQETIATIVLDELADEAAWDEKFRRDADMVSRLAEEALADDAAGRTTPLDFSDR